MIPIVIEIKKKKRLRQFHRSLPTKWEELPSDLVGSCVRFLLESSPSEARLRAAELILGLPKAVFKALSNQQAIDIVNALSWMNLNASSKPLFTEFDYKGVTRLLPKEDFMDGTCLEFALADEFYNNYINGDESALLKLAGTLCHRASKRGIRKTLIDRTEAIQLAKNFKDLPPSILAVVLLYFSGVKKQIHDVYGSYLFSSNNEEDGENEEGEGTMFGWWGAYMDVAEGGVFGNIEQVYHTSFHSICMYMVKKKKEHENLKIRDQINNTRNQIQ